ncbi:hypothetical protein AMTRI_Chr10g6870 [Amborella trichopoda]
MFMLGEYRIFWAFLMISSVIFILAFLIFRILARLVKDQKSFYVLGFVVFYVETIFLYPWAMNFDVLGVSIFIEAFIFMLIPTVGQFMHGEKEHWKPFVFIHGHEFRCIEHIRIYRCFYPIVG